MSKSLLKWILVLAFAWLALAADYEYYDDYAEYDRDSGYGGDDSGGINPLAAFIAPLAGLALLGAAAAVSINPVLIQLASINGGGKRKRRSLAMDKMTEQKLSQVEVLENFLTKETKFNDQAQEIVAQYLDCSGLSSDQNQCLERLACIYASPGQIDGAKKIEKDVIAIILYNLMSNDLVGDDLKIRMKYAGQLSQVLGGHCRKYSCPPIDQ